jgi:hypothetical protein
MPCTSGCGAPGTHRTYGECLKAKNVRPVALESIAADRGRDRQKAWDRELDYYEKVTKQGIQPAGTSTKQIAFAEKASNEYQRPYRADI